MSVERAGDELGRHSPRPRIMIYFVIDIKIEVIDMKVSVPTKLESHKLDLPRRRYGFSKMVEFCRFGNRKSAEFDAPF